jgi:hypothetical protein
VVNNMRAILPAGEANAGGDAVTVEARLFRELAAVLKTSKGEQARARLLALMAEVATKSNEETFVPYLKDPSDWVRRGALGALLRVNPTEERVAQASADFKTFLKAKPGDMFRVWQLYRVVDTDPDPAFLPLYRTLSDAKVRTFDDAAVRGLKRYGVKEDAARLYKYVRHKSDYVRHEALEGLCRILKIPLKRPEVTSYQGPLSQEAVEQERRMRAAVTRALQQEGILKAPGKKQPGK